MNKDNLFLKDVLFLQLAKKLLLELRYEKSEAVLFRGRHYFDNWI